MTTRILVGHVLSRLRELPDESVHMCVTSPPFWHQRNYGCEGQIGLEQEPAEYVDRLSEVFVQVRRVLRHGGTLWLNSSDKWASSGFGSGGSLAGKHPGWDSLTGKKGQRSPPPGYKHKDLILISFMVADRLQKDGWFLRKTIIWAKPYATEAPRRDRPSTSHEYIFLFSKEQDSAARDPGEFWWRSSVWEITPEFFEDHPAVMPVEIARRAILAGSKPGDTILDPFLGSGVTALVADQLQRNCIGIELSGAYATMSRRRVEDDLPLFAQVAVG